MKAKENKTLLTGYVKVRGYDGLIGMCFSEDGSKQEKIRIWNRLGYRLIAVVKNNDISIGILSIQLLCLICTCGLWTFKRGTELYFEKEEEVESHIVS